MRYLLMNKNTEVLVAEYLPETKGFSEILEVKNLDFAPLRVRNTLLRDESEGLKTLTSWFQGRGIPAWRDKLDLLLIRLGIESTDELLDKAYALSLSDQYWIKPEDSDIKYDDINFFDHDFDPAEFLEASLSDRSNKTASEASLYTPNNTTDGMLSKAWVIENGTRYLLKGGYMGSELQPFNEALASEISRRLGFDHVPYEVATYKDKCVSKCPCFITKDTELITAYQVLSERELSDDEKYNHGFEIYLDILAEHGLTDVREDLENMFVVDYLMSNEDRHLNNFGIIRNVETLEWEKVAPIFDTGQSLRITSYDDGTVVADGQGKFFYSVEYFDNIIKCVQDIKRLDLAALSGLPEYFGDLLSEYQKYTHFSDRHILSLVALFRSHLNALTALAS